MAFASSRKRRRSTASVWAPARIIFRRRGGRGGSVGHGRRRPCRHGRAHPESRSRRWPGQAARGEAEGARPSDVTMAGSADGSRTLRSLRLARVQSRGGRREESTTQAGSKVCLDGRGFRIGRIVRHLTGGRGAHGRRVVGSTPSCGVGRFALGPRRFDRRAGSSSPSPADFRPSARVWSSEGLVLRIARAPGSALEESEMGLYGSVAPVPTRARGRAGERHAYGPGQLQSLSHPRIGRHNMLLRKRGVLATVCESCVAGAARAHAIVDAVPARTNASRLGGVGADASVPGRR